MENLHKSNTSTYVKFFLVGVFLNTFLVSINLLGVFKSSGTGHFEQMIASLANNPFLGLLIGILATSVFQSSSTTTSLVVGLVGANFLNLPMEETLRAVIPVIMGANIGTSVTNTLVSIGHVARRVEFTRAFAAATVHDFFNFLCVIIFLPLQIATDFIGKGAAFLARAFEHTGGMKMGSPLKMMIKPQVKVVQEWFDSSTLIRITIFFFLVFLSLVLLRWAANRLRLVVGSGFMSIVAAVILAVFSTVALSYEQAVFRKEVALLAFALGLMFTSLLMLVKVMKSLVLTRFELLFHNYVFKTALRSIAMGIAFTVAVQSSSITTSLIVPLVGAGLLTVRQVFPFTMGANIGTTITAVLAALSTGQLPAIAVSFSHVLFNMMGTTLFYFEPMRSAPVWLAERFSGQVSRYPYLAFVYILLIFFVIPFSFIYIF